MPLGHLEHTQRALASAAAQGLALNLCIKEYTSGHYDGSYDIPESRRARADLTAKSQALLFMEWRVNGHVHENYNANTGEGCDIASSDRYYHCGALLGLIGLWG